VRFKIGDTTYEASSVDRLSLANILRLESETADLGRSMKWSDIKAMIRNVEALSAEELDEHDDAPWVIGLSIWASRLNAGEQLSFEQAISFPLSDLEWIADPQDHQQAAGPQKPRAASARGAKRQGSKASKRTSAPQ
jgi:hypothetical protein